MARFLYSLRSLLSLVSPYFLSSAGQEKNLRYELPKEYKRIIH